MRYQSEMIWMAALCEHWNYVVRASSLLDVVPFDIHFICEKVDLILGLYQLGIALVLVSQNHHRLICIQ